jgi:hypothetical protein
MSMAFMWIVCFAEKKMTYEIWLEPPEEGLKLDILVENMGRINFGDMFER